MKRVLLLTTLLLLAGCMESVKQDNNVTTSLAPKKKEHNITEENLSVVAEEEIIPPTPTITYTKKQQELKNELEIYLGELSSLNTEGIIEMTYPKLFIPINKNMFKRYINTILTSEHISIESFDATIVDIGFVQPYSHGEFANIRYKSNIRLAFINPELYSDQLSIRVLKDTLSSKYGEENIDVDSESRTITINKEEKLLCIKEEGESWKFIGDNREYRRLYPEILPADILSNLDSY